MQAQPTQQAMDVELYNQGWPQWNDFIRYNPGARHRRRLALKLLQNVKFSSILDVGCGNAEFLRCLNELQPQAKLEGADFSAEVVRQNTQALPQIPFHVLNIEKASIQKTFDLVTCCEVIEHLDDRRTGFTHLAKMMTPGGHLMVTCPTGKVYETEKYFGHTTHPTLEEIRGHADALGLEVIDYIHWGFPTYSTLKWATNVNAKWALRNFASGKYSPFAKLVSTALYYVNFLNLPVPFGCQLFVLLQKKR